MIVLKRLLFFAVLLMAMTVPRLLFADLSGMGNYCSAPPYVSQSIPPNIMVLIDNSPDIGNQAYTGNYSDTKTSDGTQYAVPYIGYFNPTGCYPTPINKSTAFAEALNTNVTPNRSYNASETCPQTAPFRGNLMNWATMAKYDLLETVLIGGRSTTREVTTKTNASTYTLKPNSQGATWDKYYPVDDPNAMGNTCKFVIDSGNVTIWDVTLGSCTLLDSPPTPLVFRIPGWIKGFLAWFSDEVVKLYALISHGWNGLLASAGDAWGKIDIVKNAWAATATITVGNLSAIAGQQYTLTLTESNLGCSTSGNDVWTITPTTWPSWLPAANAPTLSGTKNSVAKWIGTPTGTSGSPFKFSAKVARGTCSVTVTNQNITVGPATLTVTTTALTAGQVGVNYPTTTLAGIGGYGSYTWTIVSGSLPPGLSMTSGGVISGFPTAAGSYSFNARFTDGANPQETSNTQAIPFTINSSNLVISTTSPLPNGFEGSVYNQQLSGTGGRTPYTTWIANGLPAWLFLNSSTGMLSGTPPAGSAGNTYNFTVTLTDSTPFTTLAKSFSLTISPAVSITTGNPLPDAAASAHYSTSFSASGGSGSYTWSASGLPSWLALSNSGTLSGNAPSAAETDTFNITVTDGSGHSKTASFTLSVVGSLTISTTSTILPSGDEGVTYTTYNVSNVASAVGGKSPYTWSASGLPSNLTMSSTGDISGTPAAGAGSGNPTTYSVIVTVTDHNSNSAHQTFTLYIYGGLAITSASPLPNGQESQTYNAPSGYTLLGQGGKMPYTWSISGALPNGLALNTGVISGTPQAGKAGTYPLTITLVDSLGVSVSKAFSLTINPGPSITSTSPLPSGGVSAAYSTTLQKGAGGTAPYTWSVSSGNLPPGLSLDAATGAISGTPTTAGTYNFNIMLRDSVAATATAAFQLVIMSGVAITTMSLPDGVVNTAYSQQIAAIGGSGKYDWYYLNGTTPPPGISGSYANNTTGPLTLSGTPTTVGAYTLTVEVKSDNGVSQTTDQKTYTINITNAPSALTITTTSPPNGAEGASYSYPLAASGGKSPYSFSAAGLPSSLSVNKQGNTWYISGTPAAGDANGSSKDYPVALTVTDNQNNTANATIHIIITTGLAITTTSPLAAGTVGQNYSQQISASGGTTPYNWNNTITVTSGSLPAGLSWVVDLVNHTGKISGNPTASGSCTFTVQMTDSNTPAATVSKSFSLTVYGQLGITSISPLPAGTEGNPYSYTLQEGGGTAPFTWAVTVGSLPAGLTLNTATGMISGTPAAGSSGTHNFSVTVTDSTPVTTPAKPFTLVIVQELAIADASLPDAAAGDPYVYTMHGVGGTTPYTWSATWCKGAGCTPGTAWTSNNNQKPASLALDPATGAISGSPAKNDAGDYVITFTLTDSGTPAQSISKTLTLNVFQGLRSQQFAIAVDRVEEACANDINGNDICDSGESWGPDLNGNSVWDGKLGIFQQYFDARPDHQKAQWGVTDYDKSVNVNIEGGSACIPASNPSSFYNSIESVSTSLISNAPIATGLYSDINFYAYDSTNWSMYDPASYSVGCKDPIDIPCRKNFVLIITDGSNVTAGSHFSATAQCNYSNPLEQNACVGFNSDIRSDFSSTQNVQTFIVNTGVADNVNLQNAAQYGGPAGQTRYFHAADGSNLATKLKTAINAMLKNAASGTAVSVLTTSSRGVGSMVQAYFWPRTNANTLESSADQREVAWTGYLQNLWIDPFDNLREDTDHNFKLELANDKVIKLYYDNDAKATKAATFTTLPDGSGGTLADCTASVEDFSAVRYMWEAGQHLALKDPITRTLFTSAKVVYGATTLTFSPRDFTSSTITGNATLKAALDPDADSTPYDADHIVRYIRGECLEETVGPRVCLGTSSTSTLYRDRRMTFEYKDSNGATQTAANQAWKLGDIISSTPKVFANSALNTYNIDYSDTTYDQYISSTGYSTHSSMAFVGANDGILHAFRVGYLKDKTDLLGTLTTGVKALFRNFFGSSADGEHDQIGDEVWGYIPYNAFPYLKYLASPDYGSCHLYYNDLSVRLVDASIAKPSACTEAESNSPLCTRRVDSWKTILIGGMRFGGACSGGSPDIPTGVTGVGYSAYYALDITDPENPVPLWEFSDPDLGYTSSYPGIIRTGAKDKNGNWYVAFGSGTTTKPASGTDLARSTNGFIYILDMKTGTLVKKIDLGYAAIVGDVLTVDTDPMKSKYWSNQVYFGTSYQPAPGAWAGKLTGISIPNQDLSTWSNAAAQAATTTLFTGNYPFTASPDATLDSGGTVWVFSGSGKYYTDVDASDTTGQIFVGIKHKTDGTITYPKTSANLDDSTSIETQGTVAQTTKQCTLDSNGNFSLQDVVTKINTAAAAPQPSAIGWFITLSNGERVISRPLAVGGLVDFLSYAPSAQTCEYSGNSRLYSVAFETGLAPNTISIYAPAVTNNVKSGAVTVNKSILLGPGAPPTGEAIIIPPPKDNQEALHKKIQVATGVIVEAEDQPVTPVVSKVVHWLRK